MATQIVPSSSNDHRPNSGLREGNISHAEVNAEIMRLSKTVIFGQQTRLRNGILTEDQKLSRFHAGHSLVLFFYRGLNKLPEYLIDAFLKNGISVTLVGGKDLLVFQNVTTYARSNERRLAYESGQDLLVFKDVRNHQALHIGFTRKTIYISEGFLREAINQGYASWAISSVLISQCWPLLDYLLILEFIHCAQRRLRTHFTLGTPSIIKRVLRGLNTHFVESDDAGSNEFDTFFRHYCNHLLAFDRSILGKDPYELADSIFDEAQERVWADVKLHQIARAFRYPATFHVNRDIVHQMVIQSARIYGLPLAPKTTKDILHDLRDAAEFNIARQAKSGVLLDHLLEKGEPGITDFIDTIADENAGGNRLITLDRHDGYDIVEVFKKKLEALSSTENLPKSICNEFRDLLKHRTMYKLRTLVEKFTALPKKEQPASLPYLKHLVLRIVHAAHPENLEIRSQLETEVNGAKRTGSLLKMAKHHLGTKKHNKRRTCSSSSSKNWIAILLITPPSSPRFAVSPVKKTCCSAPAVATKSTPCIASFPIELISKAPTLRACAPVYTDLKPCTKSTPTTTNCSPSWPASLFAWIGMKNTTSMLKKCAPSAWKPNQPSRLF